MDQRMSEQILKLLRREEIVAPYTFGFNHQPRYMVGTVFVHYILQNGLLVLSSIEYLVLRIDIDLIVPLPDQLQLPEMIEDMYRIDTYTHHRSQLSIIFGQFLLCTLHNEDLIILLLSHAFYLC